MYKWFANGADRTRKSWVRPLVTCALLMLAIVIGDCRDGECLADWQSDGDSSVRAQIWIALFRVPHGLAGAE